MTGPTCDDCGRPALVLVTTDYGCRYCRRCLYSLELAPVVPIRPRRKAGKA